MADGLKKCKMITNKEYIESLITEALKKKKEESKEATGASSAGAYSGPAFSMFAKDDVARSEYKRPKVKVVREEEYCDSCDRVKSECICDEPKKIEATEATTSSSVGAYDVPGFQDVNMKGNTLKGKGRSWKKTQIPGGGFVSVKENCKTFPYCNQGDINAINITSKPKKNAMYESIKNISLKTGLSESKIKNIILSSLNDNL
jgi:hypothetical protein